MAKEVELQIINNNQYDLADKEFDLEVGVVIGEDENQEPVIEYIPYGTYTVKNYEDMKSHNKYKIIAYDLMDKLNEEYIDNTNYPKTLKQLYIDIAGYFGLEIKEQTLPNENFIIQQQPAFDNMTGRSVLGCVAELFGSFAKINRNNQIEMFLSNSTEEIFSLEDMNSTLEIDNMYGPVNVVTIGLSNVEGENVTLKDNASIEQYGETTIRINDNPIVYTEELREQVIQALFNRLNGFSYIPISFKCKARLYLDCGDTIQVQKMDESGYVNTIVLNQTIKIPRTRQSKIESKALTNTEQERKYISKTKQQNTRTELIVDKLNKQIEAIADENDGIIDRQEKLELTVDGLTNTLTTAGGSNILYYAKEYWELLIYYKLVNGINNIGNYSNITESSINSILDTTITNYVKTDDLISFKYNNNKITIDSNLNIIAIPNLETIGSANHNYDELKQNTISGLGYLLKSEEIIQKTEIPNGEYTISFKYKTLSNGSTNELIIDNGEIVRYSIPDNDSYTDFVINDKYININVNNNYIGIGFSSDTDNAIIISDLMLNLGVTKLDWSQNANETITETVKIGKGITIESTADDVKFKADTDGIRILDSGTDEIVSKFTRTGTETRNLIVENKTNLGGLVIKKISSGKVWISLEID